MECCIMNLFCLNGYNGEKIRLDLNEVIGFPNNTSIEGGYDIICTLVIDSGCYHIEHDRLYSATGTLYRFSKGLDACYTDLFGSGEYHCLYTLYRSHNQGCTPAIEVHHHMHKHR